MQLHHHRTNSHQSSSVLGGLKLGSHSCKIFNFAKSQKHVNHNVKLSLKYFLSKLMDCHSLLASRSLNTAKFLKIVF